MSLSFGVIDMLWGMRSFIPFGDIVEINIPREHAAKDKTNRGFAFVEFESEDDADEVWS